LLVYLASDDARDVNGQLFTCGGNSVGWYPLPRVDREITTEGGPFTFDELAMRVPSELLAGSVNPSPAQGEDRVWRWTRAGGLPAAHDPKQG
jgi:hypothetical protein